MDFVLLNEEKTAIFRALRYIEIRHVDGSFSELAKILHYEQSWLSKQIKQKTGKTYTQFIREKRLA